MRNNHHYSTIRAASKIIYFLMLLFFNLSSIASISPTGALYINQVTSSTGYYSVKIHSEFPSNNYEVEGIQTKLPYLLAAINRFIAENLQRDNTAYIEFGYSDGQGTTAWFTTKPCRIQLPNDENISVIINSNTSCTTNLNVSGTSFSHTLQSSPYILR